MKGIKDSLVKGMQEHLHVDVVPTDTAARKPKHPYISYKITNSLDSKTFSLVDEVVESYNPDFEYDVEVTRKEQASFTLSVNVYSDNNDEAHELAIKTADWFRFHGYFYFVEINVAVVNVTNITDRAARIVDDYEARYGFDVRFRAARAIKKRIETIESHSFTGEVKNAIGETVLTTQKRSEFDG